MALSEGLGRVFVVAESRPMLRIGARSAVATGVRGFHASSRAEAKKTIAQLAKEVSL
jgi:hypothetical protein